MTALAIETLTCSFEEYRFECVWFPRITLGPSGSKKLLATVTTINNHCKRPMRYGVFAETHGEDWKDQFLERTIWCVIYGPRGPCGFAYHYDLGMTGDLRLIHAGLVEFSSRLGSDMVATATAPIVAGNLINFGRYLCTNITHVPLIASFFWSSCDEVFPGDVELSETLRVQHLPALRRLTDEYVVPVLGCKVNDVCDRAFCIRRSLPTIAGEFATRWDLLPKSIQPRHRELMESWLQFGQDGRGRRIVQDDLIQIGIVNCQFFQREPAKSSFRKLRFEECNQQLPNWD